jgi:phage terminase large subunit-like protein
MPELDDLIKRSREIFAPLGAVFKEQAKEWIFPNGATLRMRYLERDADADSYQGHAYTWMGFDEAGNWASPAPIDKLRGCLRSAHGVPCRIRLTGNPGGPGHDWLKKRYVSPAEPGRAHKDPRTGEWIVFIPSRIQDNKILMDSDPGYLNRLKGSGPSWLVKAWIDGDWTGQQKGGMLQPDKLVRIPLTAPEIVAKYGLRPNIYIDLAQKEKERAQDDPDLSCITVMAKDSLHRVHILYQWAAQISQDKVARQLLTVRKLFNSQQCKGEKIGLHYTFRTVMQQTCQLLGEPLFWMGDISIQGTGDKVFRAGALEALLNMGVLCVPEFAPWLDDMCSDWASFPEGRYKDRIDAPALGAMDLQSIATGKPGPQVPTDPEQLKTYDRVAEQAHYKQRVESFRAVQRGEIDEQDLRFAR